MTDLRDLVDIVRISRNYTAGAFPLPDVGSCIDYAITEAAEHLDAVLREKRNGDKRNTDRKHTPRSEWGQAAYMVCSALIQLPLEALRFSYACEESVYDFIMWLCLTRTGDETSLPDALQVYVNLCSYEGWDAADLLRETCAAFELKHTGRAFTVVDVLTQAEVDAINAAFVYPVLTAEQAAAQGEVA